MAFDFWPFLCDSLFCSKVILFCFGCSLRQGFDFIPHVLCCFRSPLVLLLMLILCLFFLFNFFILRWRLRLLTYYLLLLVPQLTPYKVLLSFIAPCLHDIHNVSITPAAFIPDGDKPNQLVTLAHDSSIYRPAVTAIALLLLLCDAAYEDSYPYSAIY
ncbi:hypothetical protein M431DRAFT_307568 [Trichoderma harzianum CBS 226.95]|uniref:Uncharacterized protein n=1 Tax=Trichoderma harzianum CBS 226.95 TaxID=983964 RepID=A0A2T4AR78_TRIHA|nr:hypothetical protein M431DRAFT_307568 [Trichoderma harzianum CBS 226.95]PTB59576.1 hypothetical protein M431DRAFT_307568 [Trichoderma harzianum CBS 226.95]